MIIKLLTRQKPLILFAVIQCLLLITACEYKPSGTEPEAEKPSIATQWSNSEVDTLVTSQLVEIESPAPDAENLAPEKCDFARFMRYKLAQGSGNIPDIDAALVMIPGMFQGANIFEYFARQLVYVAKTQHNLDLEIWAVERRNNCLEDLQGVELAENTNDSLSAQSAYVDYYYRQGTDTPDFSGFLRGSELPFLTEWGLALDMQDVLTIIQFMVPDSEMRRSKVFLGGHSLGGIQAAIFAGWDFDGNVETLEDAGFNNIAGLFGLDTLVSSVPEIISPWLNSLPESTKDELEEITETTYEAILNGLEEGTLPRIANQQPLDAEFMGFLELSGMLANLAPDQENTALKDVPYSNKTFNSLRFFHSRTAVTYGRPPFIDDFRYTNEAVVGLFFDDDFSPVGFLQASLGHLGGGRITEKNFPLPSGTQNFPGADLINFYLSTDRLFIGGDAGPNSDDLGQGPLYHWVNFDQVGDTSDPFYKSEDGDVNFTTTEEEVSDIQDFARTLYQGPSNIFEWYFPTRRLIDLTIITYPFSAEYDIHYFHEDRISELPRIEFLSENGFIPKSLRESLPDDYPVIPGYHHLDPVTAAANSPDYRENDVIGPLIEFIIDPSSGGLR